MEFKRNTFKRILEEQGAQRVSKDAAEELAKITEEAVEKIIKTAAEYAAHAGRKTIMRSDIRAAIKDTAH